MTETAQIRKLSLWIFFLPLIAINICLFISVNFHLLENTIFQVNQIGRSGFTVPYLDGSVSISRASRTFPQYLIFKPSMIITGILLFYYWNYNNNFLRLTSSSVALSIDFKNTIGKKQSDNVSKDEINDIMQEIHLNIFENYTGESNNSLFESRVNSILNKTVNDTGKKFI